MSDILQLDVQEGQPAFVTVIAPSPAPSATTEATGTSTSTTPTPEEGAGGEGSGAPGRTPLGAAGVIVALVIMGGMGALGYQAGLSLDPMPRGAVRYGLLAAIGALAAYDYAALGLPGSGVFRTGGGLWWLAAVMVVGGGLGVVAARSWQRRQSAG